MQFIVLQLLNSIKRVEFFLAVIDIKSEDRSKFFDALSALLV